ncbi:hypothetical protein L596_027357 [Steinernema carpocapsae]|uniref:Uncharacterized protein n=1 Tax=Steinernema carpocapsae TaxID=34508 RepID=A0A4U5M492_STECR|nr:hypothetical protein L596_027357 [Steinernema carpocapsae]
MDINEAGDQLIRGQPKKEAEKGRDGRKKRFYELHATPVSHLPRAAPLSNTSAETSMGSSILSTPTVTAQAPESPWTPSLQAVIEDFSSKMNTATVRTPAGALEPPTPLTPATFTVPRDPAMASNLPRADTPRRFTKGSAPVVQRVLFRQRRIRTTINKKT